MLLGLLSQAGVGYSGKASWREWLVRPEEPAGVSQVLRRGEGRACAKKAGRAEKNLVLWGKLSSLAQYWHELGVRGAPSPSRTTGDLW